ncbi:NAD(P)/FAD-dependent oxidoreductase [Aeromicrobium sp. 9AM]|uniref:flavin-containing monooxygenase n=1 Tax=Aeromicrobium sp. 9AM TaxID=2653126 RepID=UPI0012EFDA07|nr:NAD(P)/FAD-dependent oxidoreductase [Aeromicrobium sp. 9AM]VXB73725.1 conserved hypothetical protein [Aeromicrobium sp. 9AM]
MSRQVEGVGAVERWVTELDSAAATEDVEAIVSLFAVDSFWRDLVAFTWNITTVEGHAGIAHMLRHTLAHTRPHAFEVDHDRPLPAARAGVEQGWIRFSTSAGSAVGLVRLVDGKAWTLLTALRELDGHEESLRERRPWGADHGVHTERKSWSETIAQERLEMGRVRQPDVLVVGGSQGGLALAARLRQLDVATIVVDSTDRPGDTWRNRYKSLCLHDPVWFDHLPYLPFPENWPVYTPKDKLADWLDLYASAMEINFWGGTTCTAASWDEESGRWDVTLDRSGKTEIVRPANLVLATGLNGRPRHPVFEGADDFAGEQHHSSEHPGPESYRDKKVVIVGANNSAHDIAAALCESGADVTMIQRSSTLVIKAETSRERSFGTLYSESAVSAGITADTADLIQAATPYRLVPEMQIPMWDEIRAADQEFYDALTKAGFALDFGEDGSGLTMKFLTRGGGYYIDVGASGLVADGSIRLRSGRQISRLDRDGLVLDDGEHLDADVIVYATGFSPAQDSLAHIVSPEIAARVGRIWGLGSGREGDPGPWVGELRNMWRPTAQDGLWVHGGNLQMSRSYSTYLALQLKARLVGLPTPVYEPDHG